MISRKDGASAVVGTLPAPARPSPTAAGSKPAALAADQRLGFRLPHWLDPVSTLIGLKTAVGVVIAQSVALWLDWSPTGATLAVLMLQQTYFGRTLARAILRMTGALLGSVLGLLVLHLLVQERALMILTVSLLAGVIIYVQQGARYPYAWLFAGFSLMVLTFGNVDQPEAAFEAAVAWVSGNALGITVVLVMHGVLWPHTGERQFNALLQTILSDSARLFRIKIVNLLQSQEPLREIGQIENALIEAMPQLRLALRIAGHETGRVAALRPDYELLIEQVQALVTLVITLGESLRICRQAPVIMAAIERSGGAHQILSILDTELQTLAGEVARGQLGARAGSRDAALSRVRALSDDLFEALRAHQHDPMDMAALAAALAKMIELAMRVAAIQQTLALQAQPHGAEAAVQRLRALPPRPLYLGLASDRWRKAIATSLVVGAGAVLWIVTNWPEPGKLILFAFTAPALGALVPRFPMKALVRSLIYGPVIGAVLYFGIMPRLVDMWQLAPFLILALFPCGYFLNSTNPATSITAMNSGIWILELVNLSQGQIYPFSSFAGSLLGIVGAVAVAVIVISLVDAPIPERRFCDHVRGFFAICEQIAREMAVLRPGEPAEALVRGGRARQMEQLRLCHMWWMQLDHERFSEDERHKAALLIAAMRALAFRQSALELARLELPAAVLQRLAEPAEALRARASRAYGVLEQGAARAEPAAAVPAVAELVGPYQASLETLRMIEQSEPNANEIVRGVLVLIGLHQALVYAIHDCHDRFNALDWRLWGAARF
jgi:uncharacterized membrane protein YccC